MNYLWLFFIQLTYITQCVYGDDVGPYFDPQDGEGWDTKYGGYPFRSFKTSNLTSPVVRRMVDSPECYDGRYTFFSPRGTAVKAPEPLILDDKGHLVWALDSKGMQPYNFKVQEYQGQQHLTYWLGNDAVGGHGEGYYYMLNSSYHEVAKIQPRNGFKADLHELTITAEGTAIISIYQIYPTIMWNKKIYIWDCLFQEINITTRELIFEWRASEHHSLDETYASIGTGGRNSHSPWDWYHINSVQKDDLGNYFVSARYTHTLTYIEGKTGDTIWILGGRRNMFKDLSDGAATDFASQHFALMHSLTDMPGLLGAEIKAYDAAEDKSSKTEKLVSMFDNGSDDRIRVREYSRGLLLQITYPPGQSRPSAEDSPDSYTVRLVKAYTHPSKISSNSQGSFQLIPPSGPGKDPTIGLGYGQRPVFTEFSADGQVICDTHFATSVGVDKAEVQSYRVFKHPWVGRPTQPPKAVLDDDEYAVYVSWLGATEAKNWRLEHTSEARSSFMWANVTNVQKLGFETKIKFGAYKFKQYLRVAALDGDGNVLEVSNTIDLGEIEDFTIAEADSNNSTTILANDGFSIMATPSFSLKLAMFFLCAIAFLLTLYGCYQQYYNWRRYKLAGYDRLDAKDSEGV